MKKFKCIKKFMNIPVWTIWEQLPFNLDIRFKYDEKFSDIDIRIVEFLTDFFEEVKEEIDFNEWVGRYWDALYIKWRKQLFSYKDWTIIYKDDYLSINELNYKKTTMDNLKYWDVFCDIQDEYELDDFSIFIWKDNDWDYICQYLDKNTWVEYIDNDCITECKEVYKFLRN